VNSSIELQGSFAEVTVTPLNLSVSPRKQQVEASMDILWLDIFEPQISDVKAEETFSAISKMPLRTVCIQCKFTTQPTCETTNNEKKKC
jgi:hypothetical protein